MVSRKNLPSDAASGDEGKQGSSLLAIKTKERTVVGRGGGVCFVAPDLSYNYYRRERERENKD